ncbi:MAG: hypothetical protein V2A73_04600 [Pseudomonadota bacterium]
MEAKVDIRKLQMLNDRVNLLIDAVNQVRYSVHGIQPSIGVTPQVATTPSYVPFGAPQYQNLDPYRMALEHLARLNEMARLGELGRYPYAVTPQVPFTQPIQQQFVPPQFPWLGAPSASPFTQIPWSWTGAPMTAVSDINEATRIAQHFPNVFSPTPPQAI